MNLATILNPWGFGGRSHRLYKGNRRATCAAAGCLFLFGRRPGRKPAGLQGLCEVRMKDAEQISSACAAPAAQKNPEQKLRVKL